jgi:serine phosphatase RsbU (regulator of sigma subunit)/PAS domain-containing protein
MVTSPRDAGHPVIAGLAARSEAIRHAAALPDADARQLLEAAFAELDAAIEALADGGAAAAGGAEGGSSRDALSAERGLLRAVFQHAPAALFVLDPDGTVRRANTRAGELVGAPPGYATGRPLTAFVEPKSRAAVRSQLAMTARTGTGKQVECGLLGPAGTITAMLTTSALDLPDGQRLLVVVASPGGGSQTVTTVPTRPFEAFEEMGAVRRLDMVTAVTRLLLGTTTFSEAVTLQRCVRLLAGDFAAWVIADMERDGTLRRQFAAGPPGPDAEHVVRLLGAAEPGPGTAPALAHEAGRPVLRAHADDHGLLGTAPDGTPLTLLTRTTSLLAVPVRDEDSGYGALTFVRTEAEPAFTMADLALAADIGEHLAVAIGNGRMFRRRVIVAETLHGSLLPARLPEPPGLELSAAYLPAGDDLSGDFYDVIPLPAGNGWDIVIGDVCGKGEEAAAMTAAARHAIRVLARFHPDPADVLTKANEVLLDAGFQDRFVTAVLGRLRWKGPALVADLASAGHPGPLLIRADGRVEALPGGGLPLGLFPAAEPGTAPVTMHAGDLLLLYTDGVTQARARAGPGYFGERLADELPGLAGHTAADAARAIQSLLREFTAGNLRDDATILTLSVKAPAK